MIIAIIVLSIVLIGMLAVLYRINSLSVKKDNEKAEAVGRVAEAEQRAAVAESMVMQQKQVFEEQLAEKAHACEQQLADRDRLHAERMAEMERVYQRQLSDRDRQYEVRLAETRQAVEERFKTMAADTLDATVKRQNEMARESIDNVLSPMREAFKKLSEEMERRSLDNKAERTVLQEGIKALQQLNMQVSDETKKLTNALRGNTGFQGRWGEMVLENILEASGLEKSRWVVYQESTTTETGDRLRPDAVIHCPRGRDIIIDVKVSLKNYLSMIETDSAAERDAYAEAHVRSVENHLKGLSSKEYQNNIGAGSAGFVLMFVPHEGAYLTAMQAKTDLWQRAYDKRVVIVSPTHLITVVRLVEQMWQTEDQTANSIAIAEEATKMMDQLNDFLGDLLESEKSINKAQEKMQSAVKRLSTGNGNVLRRAEKLKNLGIKTKKDLRLKSEE